MKTKKQTLDIWIVSIIFMAIDQQDDFVMTNIMFKVEAINEDHAILQARGRALDVGQDLIRAGMQIVSESAVMI